MVKDYEMIYEAREGYITSRFTRNMAIPTEDEKSYDFVGMAYDYLDTIGKEELMETSNSKALEGYINFVKENYPKYEINEWGERINN